LTPGPSAIPLDSCNENLPEKCIHRSYAKPPGRDAAPGFLLRDRMATACGVFLVLQKKQENTEEITAMQF
jgi:hypothetical protein